MILTLRVNVKLKTGFFPLFSKEEFLNPLRQKRKSKARAGEGAASLRCKFTSPKGG